MTINEPPDDRDRIDKQTRPAKSAPHTLDDCHHAARPRVDGASPWCEDTGHWILMVQENGVPVGMKHYPPEFKADAVALYHSRPGSTVVSVAADLGVHAKTLRSWIRASWATTPWQKRYCADGGDRVPCSSYCIRSV